MEVSDWLKDRTPVVSKLQAMADSQGIPFATDMDGLNRKTSLAACIVSKEAPATSERLIHAASNSRSLLIFTEDDKDFFERFENDCAQAQKALYNSETKQMQKGLDTFLTPIEKGLDRLEEWSPKAREVLGSILWVCCMPVGYLMDKIDSADYKRRNQELQDAWGPFLRKMPTYDELLPLETLEKALAENRFDVRTGKITPAA
jgi:hypothetical protein